MGCADDCHGEIPKERPKLWGSGPVRASIIAWTLALIALAASFLKAPSLVSTLLYAAAILSGGFYFAREAVEELWKEREIGIELLMSLAIVSAAALGNWREGALVACLYSITEALEGFTISRTRFAIRELMNLVPPKARVVRDGQEQEVPLEAVAVRDRFRVRPGESIPLDGKVIEGFSTVNEAPITGESMPVEHKEGDAVFAGTLNGEGTLLVEASKVFKESTVAKIVELVERAQAQKGRSQLLIEKFGKVYSPAVLGSAILLVVVPAALGLDVGAWLRKAVTFLVAASPCALAVATPVTLVAAIGSAARKGVLLKGGAVLEALARVKAIALDKTGTLTHGVPVLVGVYAPGNSEDAILRKAAALECFSEHPIGKAIARAASERKLDPPPVKEFRAITAAGVEGVVEGRRVAVLKPSAAEGRGVSLASEAKSWERAAEEAGRSVVVVVEEGALVGLLAVADTIRPEAAAFVQELRSRGIEHVVILTGDNPGTAKAIAAQAGIEEVHAGLLPEDKVSRVTALREKYGAVAMVGDGVNDAPALAAANVGIAMGAKGSDVAIAAADVALLADDLSKLAYVLGLARRSRRVILQNISMAVVIVGALIFGTLVGEFGMLTAVLGHEGSEVLIILNGLRVAWK